MRKLLYAVMAAVLTVSGQAVLAPAAQAADTGNSARQTGRIVSEEPGQNTPDILDGTVYSMTQVGNTIVVGGQFTRVRNHNTSTVLTRNNVFAFDATTGRVSRTFAPETNNTVYKVQAAPDGTSVFVGGRFNAVGATAMPSRLFKADVASGTVDPTFAPPTISGDIRDLEVVGSRLWLAGKFTHIGSNLQRALATVNAATGKYDAYFTGVMGGTHRDLATNPSDVTNVVQISSNPANTRMTVVGNFTSVDGTARAQIATFDTSGGDKYALSPWSTTLFTSRCSSNFETYVSDVEYAPDGKYFVVSTSGAFGGSSASMAGTAGCDVVARFESSTTAASSATWTAYTGGDTTWTVEVTDDVVYVGGHQRWQNNPRAGDAAGAGAVSRDGIAALNPVNGMAYSWNPTRARGVGVQDLLATDHGLYVGSDTELLGKTPGNTYHPRIGVLPLSGGKRLPVITSFKLPGDVYFVATGASKLLRRDYRGAAKTTSVAAPAGPGWSTAVGAFMVNGVLYRATKDGLFTKQTFDGSRYGTATPVNAADLLVEQNSWHTDVRTITSLFYAGGHIYYTKSGTNALYRRGFETESDIVGQQRFSTTTSGINWSSVRGAYVANGKLFYGLSNGRLRAATWNQAAHAPVAGTSVERAASGWSARVVFPYQGAPAAVNEPPSAVANVSCDKLRCSFDASASSDPENGALTYDWDFGDGTAHGKAAKVTHDYASVGDRPVTLKVTDNRGASSTASRTASPTDVADSISFVASANTNGNRANHSAPVPTGTQVGDTMLLFFTGNSVGPVYTGPEGWQEVLSDNGDTFVGRLYSRKATASDIGGSAVVTSRTVDGASSFVKGDVTLATYRGVGAAGVSAAAITPQDVPDPVHQTPVVDAADGNGWLVSFWSDRSSATTEWAGPSTETQRSLGSTTGTSYMSSLLMDSGRRVSSGAQGGLNATANSSSPGLTMSVLLRGTAGDPAPDQPPAAPANAAPTARISAVSCTGLVCWVNGSTSSDPDGDTLTHSWDFGDDTDPVSGASPSHTYATAGSRTVVLTVSDGNGHSHSDSTTLEVTPPTGEAVGEIAFVGATSTNGNRLTHATSIPADVEVGDTLVAFLTVNTADRTFTPPSGWTELGAEDGNGIHARAWTRTATAADTATGARVTVLSSGPSAAKSDLTVAAYRGTAGGSVAASASKVVNTTGDAHTSPAVTATGGPCWLVTYWGDKSSATTSWSEPAGQSRRASSAGSGSGHVSALLTDSNGPVAPGRAGELTATTDAVSSRGASFSVLLRSP